MLKRPMLPADREHKCRARRSDPGGCRGRFPDAGLPTGGLTLAEVARDKRRALARTRWEALSPEERARRFSAMGQGFKKQAPGDSEGDFIPGKATQVRWDG